MREVRKTLPLEVEMAVDTLITMDELWDSVKRGKPNKATGDDGINQEVFKVAWDAIKHELLEMVNQMYEAGMISDNQKHRVMVCTKKNPTRRLQPFDPP
jgi:hypothetical protein